MSRQPDTPKNDEQCHLSGNPPQGDSAKDKTNGDATKGKMAKDDPQAVRQAIERNREAFEKGAQVPGGAYDVDPAYAAAAAEGADDSLGGDLDEQSDQPSKLP